MERPGKSVLADNVAALPAEVRTIVRAALRAVRSAAPGATEQAYRSRKPASRSTMWKLARFGEAGGDVVGIGAFSRYAALYFFRGRELDDRSGLLQGSGKSRFVRLRSPAEASSPAVKRLLRRAFRLGPSA